jgi:hypothetical protein
MPVEMDVRVILLAMAKWQRTHQIAISALMAEIVGLRETVRALDPAFSEVMEAKRRESVESSAEAQAKILAVLDQTIQLATDLIVKTD